MKTTQEKAGIVIIVEGGCIQAVRCDTDEIKLNVEIVDYDDLEAEGKTSKERDYISADTNAAYPFAWY